MLLSNLQRQNLRTLCLSVCRCFCFLLLKHFTRRWLPDGMIAQAYRHHRAAERWYLPNIYRHDAPRTVAIVSVDADLFPCAGLACNDRVCNEHVDRAPFWITCPHAHHCSRHRPLSISKRGRVGVALCAAIQPLIFLRIMVCAPPSLAWWQHHP